MNFVQKTLFVVLDAPTDFIRRITMPPPADDMWFRPFAAGFPFFGTIFVFLANEYWQVGEGEAPPVAFWICLGVSIPLGILIYCVTERDKPPRWSVLFSIFTFIFTIMWIQLFSGIMIDLIGLLGIVLNINTAYLGATLLAWGNSVGDMVANVGISR